MFEYIFEIVNVVPIDPSLDFELIVLLQGCYAGMFLEAIVFLVDPYY